MKSILDRAIQTMRDNTAESEQVAQAAARVREKLEAEHSKVLIHPATSERISGCADFRSLIPAYLTKSLTQSRALLLEDHTRECVECRRALEEARVPYASRAKQADVFRKEKPGFARYAWIAAAAALILAVSYSQMNTVRDRLWPIEVSATAQRVEGSLFLVSGETITPLTAGRKIERNDLVRTAKGSGAILQLPDGSKVEMRERSELSLDRANDGVEIELARGSVIVTAAKQRTGHLYVSTEDVNVAVVGTVFSVNTGTKGSRVSVLEGEVQVEYGEAARALLPGEQITTHSVANVPLEQEIAWSQEAEIHRQLLRELMALNQAIGQRIAEADLRYTSKLVPLAPGNTLMLVSLPNLTDPFGQAYEGFRQRVLENQTLRPWWNQQTAGEDGISLDDMISRIRRVGGYLGSEIVIAVGPDEPVIMAEATQPVGLASALADLKITDLVVRVSDGLLLASPSAAAVDGVLNQLRSGVAGPFSGTKLYSRLASAYQGGVGWLLAADLERLIPPEGDVSGFSDAQQLLIEQKTGTGKTAFHATLGFNQPRRGMVSWLAEPASMGSLEFVSASAYGAAGVVTKDPTQIVDDIFGFLLSEHGGAEQIQEFQQKRQIDIRRDLASPLGGEFLFAIDGPILPTPAWKMVAEVYDAPRLQNTIQWLITEFNREAVMEGTPEFKLTSEIHGGRTFHTITGADIPFQIHYTYWAGYLIAAANRTLVAEAIGYKETGNSLGRSSSFRAQIPADGRDYFSGFFYQNLSSVTSIMPAGVLPSLVCLYGQTDQIVMASKGVLATNLASLAGMIALLHSN